MRLNSGNAPLLQDVIFRTFYPGTQSVKILPAILGCVVALVGVSAGGGPELTAGDLLAAYERLTLLNQALHQGKWTTKGGKYSKALGMFNSREVEEAYLCGDVCPQYGRVVVRFVNVPESECASIGDSIYSNYWGRQYQGCSPLVVREGLVKKDGSSWSLFYAGRSKDGVALLFDDHSLGRRSGREVPCREIPENHMAAVTAIRSGESLAVLKLEM
jgi:hypothetical protein